MMIQTTIKVVEDRTDQEVAQVAHRVPVARVVLELLDGTQIIYERSESVEETQMLCPDCNQPTIWDEELRDYRHSSINDVTHRCWLLKDAKRAEQAGQ